MEPQKDNQEGATKYNVLFVDDEEMIRNLASQMLNILGYNVITAGDGGDALITIENNGIDAVITDITMKPKMGGDEMSKIIYDKALRGEGKYKVPIIVISGYEPRPGYDDELERAVATAKQMSDLIGISDDFVPFLQKPFNLEKLKEKLKQILPYENNQPNLQSAST